MEHTTCPVPKRMKLLITILNKDDGEEMVAFYRDHGITFNMIAPAHGAAGLEIMDYLGLHGHGKGHGAERCRRGQNT